MRDKSADAYIMETGANSMYFANVSSTEWTDPERPLLIALTPHLSGLNITNLVPHYGLDWAEKSNIPHESYTSIAYAP